MTEMKRTTSATDLKDSLPRPRPTTLSPLSPAKVVTNTCHGGVPSSWQIHAFFGRDDESGGLRYGLLNFIHEEEVEKFAVLPVHREINFRHMLELVNLYNFRVKKLCTFVTNELKERDSEFNRDFPNAIPAGNSAYAEQMVECGVVVQLMSTALRNNYKSGSVADILSSVMRSQGLVLLNEDFLLDALKQKAFAEGFVFVQPQAVNKRVVLDLILSKEVSYFLMARSTPPVDYVYDMVKLCLKASKRDASHRQLIQDKFLMSSPPCSPVRQTRSERLGARSYEDIQAGIDMANPVKFYVPPELSSEEASTRPKMFSETFKDRNLQIKGVLVLLIVTLAIVCMAAFGLLTSSETSWVGVFIQVLAVSAVVPALLCFKLFFVWSQPEKIILNANI